MIALIRLLLAALGHTVRLMPARYVKAYVKRQKNDAVALKLLAALACLVVFAPLLAALIAPIFG